MPGTTFPTDRSPTPTAPTTRPRARRRRARFLAAFCATLAALGLSAAPAAAASNPDAGSEAAAASVTIRGGDTLYTESGARCVIGYNATDGTGYFGIVPGHCADLGTQWYADPARTTPVGTSALVEWPRNDYGLVRYDGNVNSPAELSLAGTPVPVTGVQAAAVGSRLCHAGSTTGVRCGTVTRTNVSVSFPEGVVHGLIESTLCAEVGDQGSPAYVTAGSGVRGVGFTTAGLSCHNGGRAYHTPLSTVLNATGLTVTY